MTLKESNCVVYVIVTLFNNNPMSFLKMVFPGWEHKCFYDCKIDNRVGSRGGVEGIEGFPQARPV